MLTQERLKELLDYDPDTGVFTWKVNRRRTKAGDAAGCLDKDGYCCIQLDGTRYKAHRLAFLFMEGEIPEEVDHINRERSDNRWCNLRPANKSENQRNKSSCSGSSSKWLGVHWHKQHQKWTASIRINGKGKHLGYFDCEHDAATAYNFAAHQIDPIHANYNTAIGSTAWI